MTKPFIFEEQSQIGQKQLSVRQHWCIAFADKANFDKRP